jgi:hypothetical protein
MAIMASGDPQAQLIKPQQSVQARPTPPTGQNELTSEPPLELPLSFRKILYDMKTKDPTILDRRYQELRAAEKSSSPVEEGGVVKLSSPQEARTDVQNTNLYTRMGGQCISVKLRGRSSREGTSDTVEARVGLVAEGWDFQYLDD